MELIAVQKKKEEEEKRREDMVRAHYKFKLLSPKLSLSLLRRDTSS